MAKAFYHSFGLADGRREAIMQIKKYDTKHGVREVGKDTMFIYHNCFVNDWEIDTIAINTLLPDSGRNSIRFLQQHILGRNISVSF